MARVVIWGLRNTRHSHRYIHHGFSSTFESLGHDVLWLDDKHRNRKYLEGSNLVFAVNVASKHLYWTNRNQYVLHNLENTDFQNRKNVLNLQVYTNDSLGAPIDESIALYNQNSRTLFQPWGISEATELWKTPAQKESAVEYWVGAIWNNELNQGNAPALNLYSSILKSHGIHLRRVGGTRSFRTGGITPEKALALVNASPVGSAIVGEWQKSKMYVPCRVFKNIAAGHVPTSNANFGFVLKNIGFYSENINEIVEFATGVGFRERSNLVHEAQKVIQPYTYARGIKRILDVL